MLQHKRTEARLLQRCEERLRDSLENSEWRSTASSSIYEATPEVQQAGMDLPDPSHIVAQKKKENTKLKQQLAFLERKNETSSNLVEEVRYAVESLQRILTQSRPVKDDVGFAHAMTVSPGQCPDSQNTSQMSQNWEH